MLRIFFILFIFMFFLVGCSSLTPHMAQSIITTTIEFFSSRIINYTLLLVGLVIFSFFINKNAENSAMILIGITGFFTMIVSSIYYWRLSKVLGDLSEKEIFVEAINRGLAQVLVSGFVLLFLLNIFNLGNALLVKLLKHVVIGFYKFMHRLTGKNMLNPAKWTMGCFGLMMSVTTFLGIPFFYFIILIATRDLQDFLFGNQDNYLGWYSETSFRFSTMIEQLTIQWEKIQNDPSLAFFIAPLIVFIGVVIKVGGALDAIKKIKRFFTNQPVSN